MRKIFKINYLVQSNSVKLLFSLSHTLTSQSRIMVAIEAKMTDYTEGCLPCVSAKRTLIYVINKRYSKLKIVGVNGQNSVEKSL